jgi:hypothetical protein
MIMKIVHDLRIAKGTNAKLKILKEHSDNEFWKSVLLAMYDTSINYYISAPNDNTFADYGTHYYSMLFSLEDLSKRKYTGNNAKRVALELSQQYGEIVRLILGGSLRAGVSITTINKAYPGLIPTFPVMLANKDAYIGLPLFASIKYDGVRLVVFVSDSDIILKTRSGKVLDLYSLQSAFKGCPQGVYDGELILGDGKQVTRTKITGFVNRILKGGTTDIPSEYKFMVFDLLTDKEWAEKVCYRDFLTRLHTLNEIQFDDQYIRSIGQEQLERHSDINDMHTRIYSEGYEGLILRNGKDEYVWKRSNRLIKIKTTHSCSLTCKAVIGGTGKYESMIGALLCEGVVEDKFVVVKLGTGLSDFDRDMDDSYYVDSIIDVQYNDIVKAKNADHYSLFLPVFKRVMGDYSV